jgi:excinuclease UvrABC nuclease subunit
MEETYWFESWSSPSAHGNNCKSVPDKSGVYCIVEFVHKNESYDVIYIGSASSLKKRYTSHQLIQYLKMDRRCIWFYFIEIDVDYKKHEIDLIFKHKPKYNKQMIHGRR